MRIETNFEVDQGVWCMRDNKPTHLIIRAIHIRLANEAHISHISHQGGNIYKQFNSKTIGVHYYTSTGKFKECDLFKDLDSLLEELRRAQVMQPDFEEYHNDQPTKCVGN